LKASTCGAISSSRWFRREDGRGMECGQCGSCCGFSASCSLSPR
jgi:hypothetical protein